MIPRVEVVVPFASAIAKCYPKTRIEGRRDFRHLVQLVRASALLHFRQRERGPDGEVIAALTDYAVAERLARAPLGAAACGIGAGAREFLAVLQAKFKTAEFTTTDAQKLGGASRRTISTRLHELNGAGALDQTVPPKGRVPAAWKLTGVNPAAGEGVLPTVEQVQEAMSGCQQHDMHELDMG